MTDDIPPVLDLRNHKVLVTGAGGFLGRHVLVDLERAGVTTVVPVTRERCDLADARAVSELISSEQPEVIIHLAAAQGGVAWQKAHQATAYLDNARMMDNLVTAAIACRIRRFVFAASSICYPADATCPYREHDLWTGPPEPAHWGYAQAKRGGIALLRAAYEQHGLSSTVVMPANLYGPGARFDPERSNVVAATIRRCVEARDRTSPAISCWGTGTPSREFLFVADAAEGIRRAAEHRGRPDPINLGTGRETTIAELVEIVAECVGFDGDITWDHERPDGAARVCMDCESWRRDMGWMPGTALRDGIAETVAWWLAHRE